MDRRGLRRWGIVLLLIVAFIGLRQCQRSYARVAPIHVEVLSHTASKLYTLIESGRRPDAMAEFVYPSRRAHEFLTEYRRQSGRNSYAQLQRLLEEYDALVRDADMARVSNEQWNAKVPELVRRRDAVLAIADEFRVELERE